MTVINREEVLPGHRRLSSERLRGPVRPARGSQTPEPKACVTVRGMSKTIQIRNVPDGVHREAKARAARAGLSLSDFLLRELERALSDPPVEDVLARIAARERPRLSESPAQTIRRERERR